ncbi:MAG: hypothetical protein WCD89_21185 [Anaerocolumna sp.]
MKRNNIIHNWIVLLILGFSMCSLCVCYAAVVDTGTVTNKKSEAMDFIFSKEYEDDFKVKLIADSAYGNSFDLIHSKNTSSPLEAYMDYNHMILNISGVEAFDLTDFVNGNVNLAIDYRMIEDKNSNGTNVLVGVYDLGNIPFFLSGDDPYWRIGNNNGVWGIGIPDIGIPDEVYKLTPENLTGFCGYNTITTYKQRVLKGTITIGKFLSCQDNTIDINLSSLGLSDEINRKIIANGEKSSTLEIMANYYFSIPFEVNQETSEDIAGSSGAISYDLLSNHPRVQGKITLKKRIKVIHDMENKS